MRETSRARLRRMTMDDLENMHTLESDPLVVEHIPLRKPISKDETRHRLENQIERQKLYGDLGVWAAEFHSGEFIGWFMLIPADSERGTDFLELGFMVVRKYWGQGLTTEICQEMIRYVFNDLGLTTIQAVTDDDHLVSIAVLEKLGFKFFRTFTKIDNYSKREIKLRTFQLLK